MAETKIQIGTIKHKDGKAEKVIVFNKTEHDFFKLFNGEEELSKSNHNDYYTEINAVSANYLGQEFTAILMDIQFPLSYPPSYGVAISDELDEFFKVNIYHKNYPRKPELFCFKAGHYRYTYDPTESGLKPQHLKKGKPCTYWKLIENSNFRLWAENKNPTIGNQFCDKCPFRINSRSQTTITCAIPEFPKEIAKELNTLKSDRTK